MTLRHARKVAVVLALAMLLLSSAPVASAGVESPCTVRYDIYTWPVLGIPVLWAHVDAHCRFIAP